MRRGGAGPSRGPYGQREEGQIGLLILGACVLALTLVVGIVNVTAVQLARVHLYDIADAAALDAADAVRDEDLYASGVRAGLPLTDDGVRESVARFLAGTQLPVNVSAWALERATVRPGEPPGAAPTVEVSLTGTVELPLGGGLLAGVSGPVTITVNSTADPRTAPS